MNVEYNFVLIEEDVFEIEIKKLMDFGVCGFNIIILFKEYILLFLDELEDFVVVFGVVNIVLKKEDKWYGFNIDGKGYLEGLEEICLIIEDDFILIIGVGGVSKVIYLVFFIYMDVKIIVINCIMEKVIEMMKDNENYYVVILEEVEK